MTERKPLYHLIEEHARCRPNKLAIVTPKEAVTYSQLQEQIEIASNRFHPEKRALLMATPSTDFIASYFAIHRTGGIAIPIDPRITAHNLAYIQHEVEEAPPSPRETADILYTTGTTGRPKGVLLTHADLAVVAAQINTYIGNSAEDRELMPLPLYHSFGLGRLRCCMAAGATLLLCNGLNHLASFFRMAEEHAATGLALVPAGLALLLRLARPKFTELAPQLQYLELGSAPMSAKQKQELCHLLPTTRIYMHYGLTEASRATFLALHDALDHLDSIGSPRSGLEMHIDDQQRLWVRGEGVAKRYLRGAIDRKGDWLCTGDLAKQNEEGYLYLLGREDEMIKVGGHRVAPMEVEEQLCSHPSIQECACVGSPDPNGLCEEVLHAYLVAEGKERPTNRELLAFLRTRLEPYKLPTLYTWVTHLPKTTSGKLRRSQLRGEYDAV